MELMDDNPLERAWAERFLVDLRKLNLSDRLYRVIFRAVLYGRLTHATRSFQLAGRFVDFGEWCDGVLSGAIDLKALPNFGPRGRAELLEALRRSQAQACKKKRPARWSLSPRRAQALLGKQVVQQQSIGPDLTVVLLEGGALLPVKLASGAPPVDLAHLEGKFLGLVEIGLDSHERETLVLNFHPDPQHFHPLRVQAAQDDLRPYWELRAQLMSTPATLSIETVMASESAIFNPGECE